MSRQESRKTKGTKTKGTNAEGTKAKGRKKQDEDVGGLGKTRALLLGAFVVVVTGAAMFLMGGEDKDGQAAPEAADDGVVIVSPAVPTANMVSASWRTGEQREKDAAVAEETEEETESLLDTIEWADDDGRREYEKSIERTMSEIHGLGVYVAPLDEDKKNK